MGGRIIAIEGSIGVGKTTLGMDLARQLGGRAKFYPETVLAPMLKLYLSDMSRYSFAFQAVIARERMEVSRSAQAWKDGGGIAILDRSVLGDMAFASYQREAGNINDQEWEAYSSIIYPPVQADRVIYLKAPVETLLARIERRGRAGETVYTVEYLTMLEKHYQQVFKDNHVKVEYIDWSKPRIEDILSSFEKKEQ